MTYRALIVDDEPLARERVRTLLANDPEVEVVGESSDARAAAHDLVALAPDLVFLDVQMPEGDGFEALEIARPDPAPVVIFVTAYDRYALKAFEAHAQDYLLKPFESARFVRALARAKARIRAERRLLADSEIQDLLDEVRGNRQDRWLERLVVKSRGRVYFVEVESVEWFEAQGNYLGVHLGPETHLIRGTMKRLEKRLDPKRFLRIHRSYIVNMTCISEVCPMPGGESEIVLKSGDRLTTGQSYRAAIHELLANPF